MIQIYQGAKSYNYPGNFFANCWIFVSFLGKLRNICKLKMEEPIMATYILLSTLTDEGAKTIRKRPERIQEVNKELEEYGAKVTAQYAVLGPYDFVSIVEAPDNETIMRISVEMGSRGTVKILTLAAVPIDEFVRKVKS